MAAPWTQRYKPAASARTHALVAACLWTAVGGSLLLVGIAWSRAGGRPRVVLILGLAAVVGLLKGRFVLGKTAQRILDRIARRGEGRCLGGFISWQTWLMVIGMMILGRLLRAGLLPRTLVAFVYEAVGVALLIGAISLWRGYVRLSQSGA